MWFSVRSPSNAFRMQDQLLHAPVHDFSDVEFVFRRARHFVNPSKLFLLFAGVAKDAKDLPVQRQFIDADGEAIRGVAHLIGDWRNTAGAGCAGVLAPER